MTRRHKGSFVINLIAQNSNPNLLVTFDIKVKIDAKKLGTTCGGAHKNVDPTTCENVLSVALLK